MKSISLFVICLFSTLALAEDPVPAFPEAPALPAPVQSGETLEPEVTIIESDKGTIYEYRANGQLYMIKVQPAAGPAYYLMDTDGDGQMDVRDDRPWNNSVNQWILWRF